MKRFMNRFINILAILILFIVTMIPMAENAFASPGNPNPNGMPYSYFDSSKNVNGKDTIRISNNPDVGSGSRIRMYYHQVQIDGSNSGWVNGFVDQSQTADNGYPYVDSSEISSWASMMNGNPAFMTEGNGLIGHIITDTYSGNSYKGYLLSRIAAMSGGRGVAAQYFVPRSSSDLKAHADDYYKTIVRFETTPRPTGGIGTGGKTQFNVGDTVPVNFWAEDYSFYDRGIKVINYYIYNVDTQQTEMSFMSQINSEYKASGTALGGPSNPFNIPISGQKFVPTKAGNYEARVLITDLHDRNSQNSSSIGGTGTPYKAPFKVGNVTDPDPEPEPGPGCTVSSSTTKMDIQVDGDKDIKNYTGVASGGSSIQVEKFADISVYSTKAGTFKMNGVEMATGSGGNRKIGVGGFGSSGTVKIVFTSDDGKDCWEKTFVVDEGKGSDKCPIITVQGQNVKNGDTIEILQSETLRFKATYKDAYGDTGPASIYWNVTRPDGTVEKLPGGYEEVGGREKWITYLSDNLELPFEADRHDVIFEKGKTYKLKLNYEDTLWKDMPECAWEITIKVKDASCTITEQNKIKFKAYGNLPNPYPPGGQELDSSGISRQIYYKYFIDNGTEFDTNMGFSASAPGTWYLKYYGKKTALTGKLAANEKFDLMLPGEVGVGDEIVLVFESDTGCIRELSFEILSDKKCYDLLISMEKTSGDELWRETIGRGDTIEIDPTDFDNHRFRIFTSTETKYLVYWLNPDTQTWERKRNGDSLSNSSDARNHHYISFPKDDTTKIALDGLYMVLFYDEANESDACDGTFFVQIGKAPDGENLLIVKSSFKITPNDPQAAGTEATITFDVKNAGKLEHNTKLAVRWESSPTATVLDVNAFKPGETRKITIPTKYPQQSEDFIGNINPDKDKPADEIRWPDNRAQWPVEVTGSPGGGNPGGGGGGPGGEIPGGQLKIRVYDSGNRLLNLPNDGVYEKEKARIEVDIEQDKISQAMGQINQQVNDAINAKRADLESQYSGDAYKNAKVTVNPTYWNAVGNPMTTWPPTTPMTVNGPGIDQTYSLDTKQATQSNYYHGTIVPTNRDKVQELLAEKYVVKAEGFNITANYRVDFEVSYEECEEGDDGEEVCTPGSDSDYIGNTFTIKIEGAQTQFEVYDLWVKGYVKHTDRWDALRKAYNTQKTGNPNSPRTYDVFWAGEKFLLSADSTNTGPSPVKGATLKVTMSTTNLTSDLTSSDKTVWNGDMWRENFDKLRNGPYTFTFVLTYNHTGPDGQYHVETDTVPIRILNPVWEVVKTNRIH